jgi:hypothetical protein
MFCGRLIDLGEKVSYVELLLKEMETGGTSETSAYFYQTAWCSIPEDSHLYTHGRKVLKSQYNEAFRNLYFSVNIITAIK